MHEMRTIVIDDSVDWAFACLSVSLSVSLSRGRLFLVRYLFIRWRHDAAVTTCLPKNSFHSCVALRCGSGMLRWKLSVSVVVELKWWARCTSNSSPPHHTMAASHASGVRRYSPPIKRTMSHFQLPDDRHPSAGWDDFIVEPSSHTANVI